MAEVKPKKGAPTQSEQPHVDLMELVCRACEALRQHGDHEMAEMLRRAMVEAHDDRVRLEADRDHFKVALEGALSLLEDQVPQPETTFPTEEEAASTATEPVEAIQHACAGMGATQMTSGRHSQGRASCTFRLPSGSLIEMRARRIGSAGET